MINFQFTNDTYPVIVFIHGGKFQYGGASDLSQQVRHINLLFFNILIFFEL